MSAGQRNPQMGQVFLEQYGWPYSYYPYYYNPYGYGYGGYGYGYPWYYWGYRSRRHYPYFWGW